jgi:uncharacterized membrane protein YkoI
MKHIVRITALTLLFGGRCFGENEPAPAETAPQAISLEEAAKQLANDENNRVLGAETEQLGDKTVHVIKVLTGDGHIRHYKFDAQTGLLID